MPNDFLERTTRRGNARYQEALRSTLVEFDEAVQELLRLGGISTPQEGFIPDSAQENTGRLHAYRVQECETANGTSFILSVDDGAVDSHEEILPRLKAVVSPTDKDTFYGTQAVTQFLRAR
jgi:hypothetical protein